MQKGNDADMRRKNMFRVLALLMVPIISVTACAPKTPDQTAVTVDESDTSEENETQNKEETAEGNDNTENLTKETDVQQGILPVEWNLEEIYPDADAWQEDYDKAMALLSEYENYRGTLNTAENIYAYLQFSKLGELERLKDKLEIYAFLGYSLDPTDAVFKSLITRYEALEAKEKEISAFADPEIYELPLETRQEIFSDPVFDGLEYAVRKYTDPDKVYLGEEAGRVMSILSLGEGYGEKTFEILDSVELPDPVITMPDGTEEELTDSLYYDIIYSDEYDDDFKAKANEIVLTKFAPYANTFASLLEANAVQTYAKAKVNGYETAREAEMDKYDVDPAVYDMIIEAAHDGLPDYHRYLRAHADALGVEQMLPYQREETLSQFEPGKMPYDDAVAEVTEALGVLGDEYTDTFSEIFESGHVDVYPTDTKTTGAFEIDAGEGYLPWILFNYNGYSSDVSTIAHEGGHAVYSAFTIDNQDEIYEENTIFTHEVASMTNELLYYTYKMEHAGDEEEKLYYLENLLDTFNAAFFRQVMYAEFEDEMYQTVESGMSLDAEALSDRWMELSEQYYGDAVRFFPDNRYSWASIPHFYYDYYVYQYATSVTYAASIVERIHEEGAVEDYVAFLKLGSSASPVELLDIAGVDPLEQKTYDAALAYYAGLVDEYERLIAQK